MNANEIVKREKQSQGAFVVFPLFAECVSKPGHASNVHSDCQVSTFSVRRANSIGIGITPAHILASLHHLAGAVAVVVVAIAKHLYKISKAATHSESLGDGDSVWRESIGRKLKVAAGCIVQFASKCQCVNVRSFTKMPSQHEFRVAVNCRKAISVTYLGASVFAFSGLSLHATESPDFIGLDFANWQSVNGIGQERLTTSAYFDQQISDGISSQSSQPLNGSARHALQNQFEGQFSLIHRDTEIAQRSNLRAGKCLAAGFAAESLGAFSVFTEFLGVRMSAFRNSNHWSGFRHCDDEARCIECEVLWGIQAATSSGCLSRWLLTQPLANSITSYNLNESFDTFGRRNGKKRRVGESNPVCSGPEDCESYCNTSCDYSPIGATASRSFRERSDAVAFSIAIKKRAEHGFILRESTLHWFLNCSWCFPATESFLPIRTSMYAWDWSSVEWFCPVNDIVMDWGE